MQTIPTDPDSIITEPATQYDTTRPIVDPESERLIDQQNEFKDFSPQEILERRATFNLKEEETMENKSPIKTIRSSSRQVALEAKKQMSSG